jgi:hypothetical protein
MCTPGPERHTSLLEVHLVQKVLPYSTCVHSVLNLNLSNVESTETATVSLCKYQKTFKSTKRGESDGF